MKTLALVRFGPNVLEGRNGDRVVEAAERWNGRAAFPSGTPAAAHSGGADPRAGASEPALPAALVLSPRGGRGRARARGRAGARARGGGPRRRRARLSKNQVCRSGAAAAAAAAATAAAEQRRAGR